MFIKRIVLEGVGGEVEITRTERGALVAARDVEIEVERDASREERYAVASGAAEVMYGTGRRGGPDATNSMIHDVLGFIEQVAGC